MASAFTEIFNIADKLTNDYFVKGEVYVGITGMKDISDSLSLKQFTELYINNDSTTFGSSGNGNWLKVIDNDNDG